MVFQLALVELNRFLEDTLDQIRAEHYSKSEQDQANCYEEIQAMIVSALKMYAVDTKDYIVMPTNDGSLFNVYELLKA